jgi:hypothetical protein
MCEFISWKKYEGKVYFLTNADLDTKEGKKLLKPDVKNDLCGHGAIENFYPELKGKGSNEDCTNFSSPNNFPKEIVKEIKKGNLSRIGVCLDVLNDEGKKKYDEIQRPAWAKYEEIQRTAWAKYEEIQRTAWAKYVEIQRTAWAKYDEIQRTAWAKYLEIQRTAWAKYDEIERQVFGKIVSQKKYRTNAWK